MGAAVVPELGLRVFEKGTAREDAICTLVFSVQQSQPTTHSSTITGQAIEIDYALIKMTTPKEEKHSLRSIVEFDLI